MDKKIVEIISRDANYLIAKLCKKKKQVLKKEIINEISYDDF